MEWFLGNVYRNKELVEFGTALLTPAIAIFGSLIAYRQWLTSEKARRDAFYNRRHEFYHRLKDLMSKDLPLDIKDIDLEELQKRITKMRELLQESSFLFDRKVEELLEEARLKTWLMGTHKHFAKDGYIDNEDLQTVYQEYREKIIEYRGDRLRNLFAPYLRIEGVSPPNLWKTIGYVLRSVWYFILPPTVYDKKFSASLSSDKGGKNG
ncbi:MAG: hypothetical protein ACTSXQ_05030 [Alphaproteobacteria bacterium]